MSSIAYITDSKMLELHRLNNHKAMNFWRISTNVNFSDFGVNDLVFFLSKDKEQMNKKEKGIVGFGRLKTINVNSVKKMWENYGNLNGYRTLEEFKEAIKNVSKDKKLPKKISSFYLEDVVFFQPIYLSECGMNISRNVESYVYLKPEELVLELLKLAKENKDLWSSINDETIELEENLYSIFLTHKIIGDIKLSEAKTKKVYKTLKEYKEKSKYDFIQNSKTELYKLNGNELEIILYKDKDIDSRLLLGQAQLYKNELSIFAPNINIRFKTFDRDGKIEYLMNN